MRAAVYARYSSDLQREASIEDQYRECERAAARAGLTVVARFEDKAVSGGTADRAGYQALLSAARSGQYDVIVAEDVSRLWRNRSEFGQRSAELEDLGLHLVTAVGDDTRREGWGLMLSIKSAIAESYRREISYRTKRGLEGKALANESTGGRCYGYKGMVEVDPIEAQVVREIFAFSLTQSARRIAADLNIRGVKPPRGRSWNPSTVQCMLRNRRYLGAVIFGQTEGTTSAADSRRKRRSKREAALVARQEQHLQIVSPELFKRVQEALDNRTNRPLVFTAP